MEELIKLESYPVRGLVGRLLQDKTTRKNIIFASESYSDCGTGYKDHSQMTEEELLSAGIKPNTVRLSIGTEHIDDIIADLEKGFAALI